MEYYWAQFNNSNTATSTSSNNFRGQNSNVTTNHAWDSWDLGSGGGIYSLNHTAPPPAATESSSAGAFQALEAARDQTQYYNPDPHLTCLKLGKRHYFENFTPPPLGGRRVAAAEPKKGKSGGPPPLPLAVAPRCQVEGCEAVLVNAKDYHRRHKVCEMHAKAPKVVVHGIEQRFCQQCSRFHAVGEFDDSKRSCRRRLAGHNERRRKSSQEQQYSLFRKHSQDMQIMASSRHTHMLNSNSSECALSLLSSRNYAPWNIPRSPDLPARCSAALRELIAENRASISACRHLNQMEDYNAYKLGPISARSNTLESGGNLTLNLMQGPNASFGLVSVRDRKSDDEEEDCSELWKVPLGY